MHVVVVVVVVITRYLTETADSFLNSVKSQRRPMHVVDDVTRYLTETAAFCCRLKWLVYRRIRAVAGRNIRNRAAAYGSETVVGVYSCCKRLDFVRCIKNDRVIKKYIVAICRMECVIYRER